jgi:hypothetical protein
MAPKILTGFAVTTRQSRNLVPKLWLDSLNLGVHLLDICGPYCSHQLHICCASVPGLGSKVEILGLPVPMPSVSFEKIIAVML